MTSDIKKFQVKTDSYASPCFCVGPQNGEPLCPCAMRSVKISDGRYIQVQDLGPVVEGSSK